MKKKSNIWFKYLFDKRHFKDDGGHIFVVFQPVYFTSPSGCNKILAWKSKELLEESLKVAAASSNSITQRTIFDNTKIWITFD